MKKITDLLLLGNPLLYEKSEPILQSELPKVADWVTDLHNVMQEIRANYNFGRAIAAPQLGIMKRLIYMNLEKPIIFINPELTYVSKNMFEVWDDCMCFPNLLVKVKRHKKIGLKYYNESWELQETDMEDDLSELLQHEIDHLNGILCISKAIDDKSFEWRL